MRWQRREMIVVLGLGAALGVLRAARLIESPSIPPGAELEPVLAFLRQSIPSNAGYLFVVPTSFGRDTGTAPRLRYELFPRRYEKVRTDAEEAAVRDLMARRDLQYVVVPDATQYAETFWLRQRRDWLERIDLNARTYVLHVIT